MSGLAQSVRRWHGGQLVIAWIVLALVGCLVAVGWFNALSLVGHTGWPNADRAACLRSIPKVRVGAEVAALIDEMSGAFDKDDAAQQLGLTPADTPRFLAQGGHLYRPTSSTDTAAMLRDIAHFETYKDSTDTAFQNLYLGSRGLRLDRDCVTARYAAVDAHLSILNATTLAVLAAVPILGLWMTWVWFGGRVNNRST